jgi:pimeloyl-ACP methyl ester carboxylesterase
MATVLTYAEMSNVVYEDNPSIQGWSRVGFRPSGAGLTDAFQGVAFHGGDEVVFAFKGTSQGRDAIADIKLGIGMNTYQYASAMDFVRSVSLPRGTPASVCGHSLGGAIAQIVGNRLRLPFITFNAPGVGIVSRNLGEVAATVGLGTAALRTAGALVSAVMHPVQAAQDAAAFFQWVRGVNFRLGKDVVGMIGVHYGRVIEIPYSGGSLDVLTKHKMVTVIAALQGTTYRDMALESLV